MEKDIHYSTEPPRNTQDMKTQLINAEMAYTKLFSKNHEDEHLIRFWDDEIPDMYSHNYTFIKENRADLPEIIINEIKLRQEQNKDFLRIEVNFDADIKMLEKLPIKPEVSIYDYMYIKTDGFRNIDGNKNSVVKKAITDEIIADGKKVDILACQESMGLEFATRRIERKSKVYQVTNSPLDLYVCYAAGIAVGNCELMTLENLAKIEDFDILEEHQRKGYGSAVIQYLLQSAYEQSVPHAYLITDHSDTAKDMYVKCGFERVGYKTELHFQLK
ncbi:GNAT family N-acetyltransferase [Paenibacillus sp. SC116]|uniref:GNAT family N-acetyltransferase n=1 Tax=Paenibacillus sp. SC116 TaxID=2968986 RepID=UPI00215AD211|nr:GNAT family N-acetyltransferase [Paenibacillus sp. SC116]MCR8843317.1 GNAT family N-acetyltransferase [Paenibacillus sp. SC116]